MIKERKQDMTEHEEINRNDQLGRLINQIPLEGPSDDFVNRVMLAVQTENVILTEKKGWWVYVKSGLPLVALVVFIAIVFFTSDLPLLKDIPGEGYLVKQLFSFIETTFLMLSSAFSVGYVSWGILIGVAGGLIYLIDQAFTRRASY
jgi:hypothetical protein